HAAEHGRSLEAELRAVLTRETERATRAELRAVTEGITRAGTPPGDQSDSTDLARGSRAVKLVLDASVVVTWFAREDGHETAHRLFALDAFVAAQG
ncbi:MAG: hypothetical protein ACLFU0_09700, partial [Alphaproteobacteria bacterium]